MSYRTITVDGKDYQYVAGKSYTKIRGVGLFYNEQVGTESGARKGRYVVTPGVVADLIRGKAPRKQYSCSHGTVTHKLTGDPFDAEIYGVHTEMMDCPICYENRSDDI